MERRHPPQLEDVGFCAAIYHATNPSSVSADSKRGQDAAGSKYPPNWKHIDQLWLGVALSATYHSGRLISQVMEWQLRIQSCFWLSRSLSMYTTCWCPTVWLTCNFSNKIGRAFRSERV